MERILTVTMSTQSLPAARSQNRKNPLPPPNDKARASAPSNKVSKTTVEGASRGPIAKARPVEFILEDGGIQFASVAGTFNNWDPKRTPMQKTGSGWKATIELAPGRYEYRFVVNGEWISDARAKESVPNTFGGTNSVLKV